MATYRVEGIVIRMKDLGEADRIVTIFSRERGKVRGVARGARRPRSRLSAPTQAFSHCRFLMFPRKSLDVVSQAEVKEPFFGIHQDIERMAYATYVAELTDEMTEPDEANEPLFAVLLGTLHIINSGLDPEIAVRAFEMKLMDALGFRPDLDACSICGKPYSELRGGVMFLPKAGGIACSACAREKGGSDGAPPDQLEGPRVPLTGGGLAFLRSLLGLDFKSIVRLRPPKDVRAEAERALRAYVDMRLSRPLKSLSFLKELSTWQT